MTGVEYAIPSRARADVLCAKTLPLLFRLGIEPERIRLFVEPGEWGNYLTAIAAVFPHPVTRSIRIERGAEGMAAQRAAIHDFYPEGARFVSIDDDLRELMIRRNETTLEPIPAEEWDDLVAEGFSLCERTGARLWGLYPVPNAYFMKPRVRTDLSYLGGGLWGCVNRLRDDALRVELDDKEDFERSLRCYAADGALVRFDYVTWRTTGYQGAGGMQTDGERTPERIEASARRLAAEYPELASLNLTKKSGKAELRLRDRRRQRV